jgi:hypothetical protein
MPIRLAELTKATRTVVQTFEGTEDTLSITYRPSAWTPAVMNEHLSAVSSGNTPEALVLDLATLLVSWDLLDDKGKPIPITAESLRRVSLEVLNVVLGAINADMLPDPTPAATSNGSSPTGSLS